MNYGISIKKGDDMTKTMIFIPENVLSIVRNDAKSKGIPYSQLIRAAIWEYLQKRRLIDNDIFEDITTQAQCYVKEDK